VEPAPEGWTIRICRIAFDPGPHYEFAVLKRSGDAYEETPIAAEDFRDDTMHTPDGRFTIASEGTPFFLASRVRITDTRTGRTRFLRSGAASSACLSPKGDRLLAETLDFALSPWSWKAEFPPPFVSSARMVELKDFDR